MSKKYILLVGEFNQDSIGDHLILERYIECKRDNFKLFNAPQNYFMLDKYNGGIGFKIFLLLCRVMRRLNLDNQNAYLIFTWLTQILIHFSLQKSKIISIKFVGGNLFMDRYNLSFLEYEWIIQLSSRLNVPATAEGIGVGPLSLYSIIDTKILKKLISRLDRIEFRDAESLETFEELKLDVTRCFVGSDTAFKTVISSVKQRDSNVVFGLNFAAWNKSGYWPNADQKKYLEWMDDVNEIKTLCQAPIELVSHKQDSESTSYCDLNILKSRMAQCDVVIATRMHCCILAMILGKPVIAIAYDKKVTHLFKRYNLDHYLIDINDSDRTVKIAERIKYINEDFNSFKQEFFSKLQNGICR